MSTRLVHLLPLALSVLSSSLGLAEVQEKPMSSAAPPAATIVGGLTDTSLSPHRKGTITVEGLISGFEVPPDAVTTSRPDIFREARFSAFDVLVHACKSKNVELRYHYAPELETHVIDSIDGKPNWWYAAHYHGGGRTEEPVHRMDTHPYKDWMKIEVYQVPRSRIDEIHRAFRAEVQRLEKNAGKVIIPEVTLTTPNQQLRFSDVEVTAHNLRSDIFRPGILTAADVMLSLADQGKLTLDCTWIENIGSTLVQGYYFTRFNQEKAYGRAGFTYSLGEKFIAQTPFRRFGNNFFHMTSDIRVLLSPEYVQWRWTDLSRGGRFDSGATQGGPATR